MRGRVRRGFLKSYILKLLSEGERSGYDLMQTISSETGFWRPSSGSIYPLLQSLQETGLIDYRTEDRKKMFFLTEKGRLASDQVTEAREQMRRSLEQSAQVFERVFGPEGSEEGPHLGDRVPREIRSRFGRIHCALHATNELDADTAHRVATLMDQIIELLTSHDRR